MLNRCDSPHLCVCISLRILTLGEKQDREDAWLVGFVGGWVTLLLGWIKCFDQLVK